MAKVKVREILSKKLTPSKIAEELTKPDVVLSPVSGIASHSESHTSVSTSYKKPVHSACSKEDQKIALGEFFKDKGNLEAIFNLLDMHALGQSARLTIDFPYACLGEEARRDEKELGVQRYKYDSMIIVIEVADNRGVRDREISLHTMYPKDTKRGAKRYSKDTKSYGSVEIKIGDNAFIYKKGIDVVKGKYYSLDGGRVKHYILDHNPVAVDTSSRDLFPCLASAASRVPAEAATSALDSASAASDETFTSDSASAASDETFTSDSASAASDETFTSDSASAASAKTFTSTLDSASAPFVPAGEDTGFVTGDEYKFLGLYSRAGHTHGQAAMFPPYSYYPGGHPAIFPPHAGHPHGLPRYAGHPHGPAAMLPPPTDDACYPCGPAGGHPHGLSLYVGYPHGLPRYAGHPHGPAAMLPPPTDACYPCGRGGMRAAFR